jgi:hypothetical protein
MSTNEYILGVKQNDWPAFPGKLWQRNYWEHVVRDESELDRIREYIRNNPVRWELDKLNPRRGDGVGGRGEKIFAPTEIREPFDE